MFELQAFNFNYTHNATDTYTVFVLSGNSVYNHMLPVVFHSIPSQQAAISALTTTVAAPDSATGLAVMGTLLALDSTGTFFRFTKILQIVNKLYFININYGKRLEAFLAKSATINDHEATKNEAGLNKLLSRGKLTREKLTLSGIDDSILKTKTILIDLHTMFPI